MEGQEERSAVNPGAMLALVSVAATTGASRITDGSSMPHRSETAERDEVDQLNLYLLKTEEHLRSQGHTVQAHLLHGDPAAEIVRSSEEMDADLIVMATHGQGGLRRLCLGSVAMQVIQRATVPVLLVRAGEESDLEGYPVRSSDASRNVRELASPTPTDLEALAPVGVR
jgi:nucleotide-binding universal stress UspA family protein